MKKLVINSNGKIEYKINKKAYWFAGEIILFAKEEMTKGN